jgi:YVTN family beta-propeller protein
MNMSKELTRRNLLAGAAAGAGLISNGCIPLRSGLNPILATNDITQNLSVAIHRDSFALALLVGALFTSTPLLSSNRAFGVLALFLVANLLKLNSAGATPDAARVLMTLDDNTLVMLNPATGAVLSRVTLGQQPCLIAASPNGDFVAVTNASSHTVSIVTTPDLRVSKTIALEAGSAPYGVAVAEDGNKVYVVNEARNSISILDVAAGRVTGSIAAPGNPSKIALSPDGALLWAPAANGPIHVIDTLTDTVSTTVSGVSNPVAVAFNPTGTKAYVTSAPAGNAGNVVVVDTSNYAVLSRIPVGRNPYSITMSAGGTRAYVSNFDSNTVSVIDTGTDQVIATIQTGNAPIEVAAMG